MPITLARWISILWHPLPAIAVSVLLASVLTGQWQRQLDILLPIAALLASVLGYIGWQTWRGRWTHVDASAPAERRGLNRFLLIGLMLAAVVAAISAAAPELTLGLAAAALCMAVVTLCAPWLKISQHCLFAILPLAWLWPSLLASAAFVAMAVLVAASRLRLRRHTLIEVVCGLAVGAAAAFLLAWIASSPPAFKPDLSSCAAAVERNDGLASGPMPAAAATRLCVETQQQIDAIVLLTTHS